MSLATALRHGICAMAAAACLVLPNSLTAHSVPVTNMGKGDWIWQINTAITNTGTGTLDGLLDYEKARGIKWIVVNCGRGGTWYEQFNADLIAKCRARGLMVFGYQRCFGDNVTAEINVGKQCLALNPDGYIINAEIEFEGKFAQATQMMNGLRASYPTAFIGHAPFVYIDYHTQFPYVEFGKQCDAVFPQAYWRAAGINKTPDLMVADMNTQWNKWHTTWTNQGNGTAVKPVIPIGDGYNASAAAEILGFFTALKATTQAPNSFGYTGVSFWSCQHHNATHWANIAAGTIGIDEVIQDNIAPNFTVSTSWWTGTSVAGYYGANYHTRSTQAISDTAKWKVDLPQTGSYKVYARWTAGANRAANATYIVTHAGGNTNVAVNQQQNGGQWILLGTWNFNSGNTQRVQLSCYTVAGFYVVADAVRFVKQ